MGRFSNKLVTLLAVAVVISCSSWVGAQQTQADAATGDVQPPARESALKQLGLSRDQMYQVRQINRARKPAMEAAQSRLKEALRELDEAIYGEKANEADMQLRLKAFQSAQAEVARIRFSNEFAIRKVLSPEQLMRFREIRQEFEIARQEKNRKAKAGFRRRVQAPRRQSNGVTPGSKIDRSPIKPQHI